MAQDHGPQGRSQQPRRENKSQLGRTAKGLQAPRRSILQWIGVIAILSTFVGVMAAYGPSRGMKHGILHDWFVRRHEAQRQREIETDIQHVEQIMRDTEALRLKSKSKSEEVWKEFDKRMQSQQRSAPPQKQTEEPNISDAAKGQSPAPTKDQLSKAHNDSVVWLSASPDGSQLLSASTDKSIKLWDVKTGLMVRDVGHHADMARAALFMPGGSTVLSGADDGAIDIWSVADGKLEQALVGSEHGGVRGLAISGDGTLAASSHQSGTVVVWDLKTRQKLKVLTGHQWPASAVAMSADGKLVVSGDIDGVIRTWDTQTGKSLRIWKGHQQGVYRATFLSSDKQVVTASGDGLLKLWNVESGREVRSFPGHAGTVYTLSISSDGLKMLSGSLDGTARLWDLTTGEELAYFDNSGNRIYSVALLPDGSEAIGDESGTIRILNDKGEAMRTLAAAGSR